MKAFEELLQEALQSNDEANINSILHEYGYVKPVLCKDCTHYDAEGWGGCDRHVANLGCYIGVDETDYCSYGELK